MKEWQPIETAPKDGTKVDLWRPGYTKPRICDAWWESSREQFVTGTPTLWAYAGTATYWLRVDPPSGEATSQG